MHNKIQNTMTSELKLHIKQLNNVIHGYKIWIKNEWMYKTYLADK